MITLLVAATVAASLCLLPIRERRRVLDGIRDTEGSEVNMAVEEVVEETEADLAKVGVVATAVVATAATTIEDRCAEAQEMLALGMEVAVVLGLAILCDMAVVVMIIGETTLAVAMTRERRLDRDQEREEMKFHLRYSLLMTEKRGLDDSRFYSFNFLRQFSHAGVEGIVGGSDEPWKGTGNSNKTKRAGKQKTSKVSKKVSKKVSAYQAIQRRDCIMERCFSLSTDHLRKWRRDCQLEYQILFSYWGNNKTVP